MDRVTPMSSCLLLVVVAVAGCHGGEPGDGSDSTGDEVPVMTRDLAHGQQSGHHEADRRVIEDPEEWKAFWQKHTENQMPGEDRPEVDFSAERVVAVLSGERPNGCHHVRITNVTKNETGTETVTRVMFTRYVPPPDGGCTEVLVYPYHFIAVPADGTEVVFEDREQEGAPSG